jgi:magnesium chelatase accessory protein
MMDSFYPPMPWERIKPRWPNSAHSQFIQTQDVRWHVQILGEGPTMLLLHGLGSSTHTWAGMAPLLSKHYRLIAIDSPGHAFSSVPAKERATFEAIVRSIRELLERLQIWPSVVMGHSAGAALAAKLLLESHHPECPSLVALNPAWLPLPGHANWLFPISAKLIALNPLSAWFFAKHLSKREAIEKLIWGTGSHLRREDIDFYHLLMQSPIHIKGVLQMMTYWKLGDLPEQLANLHGSVLIQSGVNDQAVEHNNSLLAQQRIKGAQLQSLENLGHLAHEENPVACAEKILQWLSEKNLSQTGH